MCVLGLFHAFNRAVIDRLQNKYINTSRHAFTHSHIHTCIQYSIHTFDQFCLSLWFRILCFGANVAVYHRGLCFEYIVSKGVSATCESSSNKRIENCFIVSWKKRTQAFHRSISLFNKYSVSSEWEMNVNFIMEVSNFIRKLQLHVKISLLESSEKKNWSEKNTHLLSRLFIWKFCLLLHFSSDEFDALQCSQQYCWHSSMAGV